MTLPAGVLWGNWYNSTKISYVYPAETIHLNANMTIPLNATVASYTITANVSGNETGSYETVTFVLQVTPGADTKKQINISFDTIKAQISVINSTLIELLKSTSNANLTIASKKLSEIDSLRLQAEEAMLKGDYLTAYNNKAEIDAMIPVIKQLLVLEKQAVETKKGRQMSMYTIAAAIIALAAFCYYLWLPEEGYVPGRGFFPGRSNSTIVRRAKDILKRFANRPAKRSSDVVHEMIDRDRQKAKYVPPKEQPYNYSYNNSGSKFSTDKMYRNLIDQFKEHSKTNSKPNYNFHKKQRWSND